MISSDNLELIKDAAAGRVDLDGKALLALIAEVEALRGVLETCLRNMEEIEGICPACLSVTALHGHDLECALVKVLGGFQTRDFAVFWKPTPT